MDLVCGAAAVVTKWKLNGKHFQNGARPLSFYMLEGVSQERQAMHVANPGLPFQRMVQRMQGYHVSNEVRGIAFS